MSLRTTTFPNLVTFTVPMHVSPLFNGLLDWTHLITGNDHLVIFGGMSKQPESQNPEDLCVLNDVRFFDLKAGRWLPQDPIPSSTPEDVIPRSRYAHLSSVTADRLFIIGGQDFFNTWLDDICVYDLKKREWVQRRDYPRHCGTYRSVAVSSPVVVRSHQDEVQAGYTASTLGQVGSRFPGLKSNPAVGPSEVTPSSNLVHLPYSSPPTEDHPNEIYLYSNYNVGFFMFGSQLDCSQCCSLLTSNGNSKCFHHSQSQISPFKTIHHP